MTGESRPRLIVVLPQHPSERRVLLAEWIATVREFCERGGEVYLLAPARLDLSRFGLAEHSSLYVAAEPALASRGRGCVIRALRRRALSFVFRSLIAPGRTAFAIDLTARFAAASELVSVAERFRVPTIALLRRGPPRRGASERLLARVDAMVLPRGPLAERAPLGSFEAAREDRVRGLLALAVRGVRIAAEPSA